LETTVIIPIADQSQVAQARRLAARAAVELGFDEEAGGRVALIVTELSTNLLKHAGEGEILVRRIVSPTAWVRSVK
jgi:anti-sigma regulatory factor (Ser/Thr protein kinase)